MLKQTTQRSSQLWDINVQVGVFGVLTLTQNEYDSQTACTHVDFFLNTNTVLVKQKKKKTLNSINCESFA